MKTNCWILGALRKHQREMQQQSRRQQPRHDIRPVHFLVERVQLSAVVERIQNERHQAEHIEMHGRGAFHRRAKINSPMKR